MKRIVCSIIMILTLIIMSVPALAENKCVVSVENVEATFGGTALVTLKIENNPNMAIGKVKLTFDNKKIMAVSTEKREVLKNCYSFTSNLDDPNVDASELDYVTISWMNMTDISGDGTLAAIEFAVRDGVSDSTEINVEVNELANAIQNNIDVDTKNGQITFIDNNGNNSGENQDVVLGFSETTVEKSDSSIGGNVSVSVYSENELTSVFICTIYDEYGKLCATTSGSR